ncbi:MAG TPA: hypothetical protein VHY21_03320 [Pseudonocardiaceae bacterium]|nr:hypothetical protein [Pseudonocardiaceae bacterium]
MYRWAASTHPELIRRIPIRCWPDAKNPAIYYGAREIEDATVQTWRTDPGTVCVVWSRPPLSELSLRDVAAQLPDADALIQVQSDFDIFGPRLSTARPDNLTEHNDFGMRWADLARILGQPVPYWPYMLRISLLIVDWKPGAPPATYPTIPEIDTTPLLRLAATLTDGSPAQDVLLHLARVAQYRSTTGALGALRTLAECEQRSIRYGRHNGDVTVVAAHPLWVPETDRESVSEERRRGGWLEIRARNDGLAAECVRIVDMWDHHRDFPSSNPEWIDPTTEYGAEWAARLEPVERNAAFATIDRDGRCETLIDPETEALVVREPDGFLLATIPQSVPNFTSLAEVIFDRPIWVRTEDGTLYPAPKDSYWGLNYGYPGGAGPGALALLIYRLLDDINARGADNATGAPAGLEELTQIKWPRGTVFTRAQLEAARDGRPYAED